MPCVDRRLPLPCGSGFLTGSAAKASSRFGIVDVFAGWAIKGAVAYVGTKAVGEAAIRAAEARHPAGH